MSSIDQCLFREFTTEVVPIPSHLQKKLFSLKSSILDNDELQLVNEYLETIIKPNEKPIQIKRIRNTQFPKKIFERLNLFKQFSIGGVKYSIGEPSEEMFITRLSPGISLSKYKMKDLGGNCLYVIIALDRCKFMIYSGTKSMSVLLLNPGDLHISTQLNIINIQSPVGVFYLSFRIDITEA